ncbi:FUSC family protein [Carnobacterium mobile]|uniref:FUSC family protein n=1 Tax=Carnobacterium mobile TaxID=2750 RepID=UPI00186848BA|nr:FUSC family protein [Carnobacterium mobile]
MEKKKKFFQEITTIKKTEDSLLRVFGAGTTTGIILMTGFLLNNMQIGTFGALGGFAFLYYQPIPTKFLMRRILGVGVCLVLSFLAGALSTFIPWMIPITIGIVSLISLLVFRILGLPKPGAFFIIMVNSMGTGLTLGFSEIIWAASYVAYGVLTAALMASLVGIAHRALIKEKEEYTTVAFKTKFIYALKHDPELLLSSIHHAGIIFFAAYLGSALELGNPYWITISCAAVLQGRELMVIMYRNVQRVVGGIFGLLLGMFLFSLDLNVIQTIIVIMILNFFVEYAMVRNYGLANFFTNPLALLLANLSSGAFVNELVGNRFIGLVLGSIIGLIGAALIAGAIKLFKGENGLPETYLKSPKKED